MVENMEGNVVEEHYKSFGKTVHTYHCLTCQSFFVVVICSGSLSLAYLVCIETATYLDEVIELSVSETYLQDD